MAMQEANRQSMFAIVEEVLRGLQALNFIADQLVNQLLDQPTPIS